MAGKESYRERQESELLVLQSIFGSDAEDLRTNDGGNGWKPLNLLISLLPQQSSNNGEAYTKTKLHLICSAKYPKIPPKISLEETKGLSDGQKEDLLKELNDLAQEKKGEVMIYDLTQIVQAFLHKHNKVPIGSFYEQMLKERIRRDEVISKANAQKLCKEQQVLRDELRKRQDILRNETRYRRETRRSMSESSPTHRTHSSSVEITDVMEAIENDCILHMNSEDLYFATVGRKIRKGCCLGHSKHGCVVYAGLDSETGQLLYISEWNIKYTQLETKCTINCHQSSKCGGHSVDDIVQSIEKEVAQLAQLRHKNIISYECVLCMKKREGVIIYLAQDFVHGSSLSSVSNSLGWSSAGVSRIAKGILDVLIFLHNKGVSHSHLNDTSVFVDNKGLCRVGDFSLISYLCKLNEIDKYSQGDLPALGSLIESLLPSQNHEMSDFIEHCKSERTLSASDLLEHPFLTPINTKSIVAPKPYQVVEKKANNENEIMHTSLTSARSRLNVEFEVLQWLGQGAYGDVLKVKNILDNRQYAIKRIPLTSRSRQIYKKMTREVELLSRLNHENVVRYYNSWIESATEKDLNCHKFESGDGDASISVSINPDINCDDDSLSSDWMGISRNVANDDSSSDGIEFINSDGEVVEAGDDSDENDSIPVSVKTDGRSSFRSPKQEFQIMYIQMEFCEKSTLRTAIDDGLYKNPERLWRLFREIVEGLSHIHQQGMIHRDLKPVNIFLDSRDQVKIGDFGLATTSFLALQQNQEFNSQSHNPLDIGSSHTGKVGTALYVAPELMGKASKSTYNQKVDLYSLGIIFFEMSAMPFETGMERVETLTAIRSPNVVIPKYMQSDPAYSQIVKIIKWLLHHDQNKRPTADELLVSDLFPPAQLEDNDVQEMLRTILANPQSKTYKHLVARCLAQGSDTVLELTYHLGLVQMNARLELVKAKITALFRRHGGIEVVTPLLSPYVKTTRSHIVRLMTHSGSVVVLPHDLRIPFIKHSALSGLNCIRRYSIGRVYREKKIFNFHPKQIYECAFDIVTPSSEGKNRLIDAELISIAYEITNEIPALKQRTLSFRINHTSLLRAILINNNVPSEKYSDVFAAVLDFMDRRISKFQLHSTVTAMLDSSKHSSTNLIDMLLAEFPLGGKRGFYSEASSLRQLIRGHSEASSMARGAMEELELVVSLAQSLGVTCAITLHAGLSSGYERARNGGIIWQMLGDFKPDRKGHSYVLGVGGRYDGMLADFQKQAQHRGVSIPNRSISGAGFSFALDKILSALNSINADNGPTTDVVVCVAGARPALKEVTPILRSLWTASIQCAVVECNTAEEGQDMAKDMGAVYYVIFCEDGTLHLRSWINDKFEERLFNREELITYLKRALRPDPDPSLPCPLNSSSGNNDSAAFTSKSNKSSILSVPALPNVKATLISIEKITSNSRRRYENLMTQHMSTSLALFNKREEVHVIIVELPSNVLRAIAGALDPRGTNAKDIDCDIGTVIHQHPDHKRYIKDICEEITDIYLEKKIRPVIGLYSLKDSSYRFIL